MYFFDTYALIELVVGNPNYKSFNNQKIVTSRLNLMEFHYALLRIYDEKIAQDLFESFLPFVVKYENSDIIVANLLRKQISKRDVSYIDCIGYVVAIRMKLKFLTGDKAFADFENVEFIK